MVVIAGCIIVRDNKILMVKEAKKKCYGQWNFPAGHVDELEKITDAAVRETSVDGEDGETRVMVRFTADILEEDIKFDTDEILDVKWLNVKDVKNMTENELRGYDTSIQFIKDFEENKIYSLDIFNNTKYVR